MRPARPNPERIAHRSATPEQEKNMPKDMMDLPLIARAADVVATSIDMEARTVEVVWTTGSRVQRVRWEGWDDRIEYDEELVVDDGAVRLERLNGGAPFLNSHYAYDLRDVIGSVVPGSARVEDGKGYATIQLTDAADAASIVQRILEKTVRHVSVGYRVHEYQKTEKAGERELWRAVDWEPMEISAVAMPADTGAHIRSLGKPGDLLQPCVLTRQDISAADAANRKDPTMPDTPKAAGGDQAVLDGGATETRAAPTTAPTTAPVPAAHPTREVDADAVRTEERKRVSDIDAMCARHAVPADLRKRLIDEGRSVDQAREAVMDHIAGADSAGPVSGGVPAQARGGNDAAFRDAMTNALMHRHNPGGIALDEGGREFRGMSLIELSRAALERMGISTRGMSKMELAGAVFERRASGMHSTSDFPSILANVANKTLRSAYDESPRTFTGWARRATITDFKPVDRVQLGAAPELLKVNESGEIEAGTMGGGKETYALATYGRIVSVTRQVLINDDLDAFTRLPAAFGARAASLESDIVYAILISNPTMADGTALFHADHGNLNTASVISEAALAKIYRAMGAQTGLGGERIRVLPRFLLVPPGDRSVEARKNVTSTTPSSAADVNAFAGRLEVIEDPRLIPAAGQDPWFVAADPAAIDTVEFAYLEGQEGVYTETKMGFEVDGMQIKARHDFAAAAIDHRGLAKNPGAAPA